MQKCLFCVRMKCTKIEKQKYLRDIVPTTQNNNELAELA